MWKRRTRWDGEEQTYVEARNVFPVADEDIDEFVDVDVFSQHDIAIVDCEY